VFGFCKYNDIETLVLFLASPDIHLDLCLFSNTLFGVYHVSRICGFSRQSGCFSRWLTNCR